MEHAKAMHDRTHEEILAEPKNADVEGPATARHIEGLDVPPPHLHKKTFLIVAAVSFTQFANLIQLVATGAFASTVASVVGGADISGWMLTALTITFVVFAPPVSQGSDYWGRRWILIILTLSGCIGTIITSRAQSMGVAILGEVFVGAAFATTPLSFAVASEVLPHRHRLAGQACINSASGLGAVFSLLLGAKLIEVRGPGGFRILWYINAGVYAAAAIICFFYYRPPIRELQASLSTKEKLYRLDWPGYAITMCAAVMFCMGFSWADNPYDWKNPHVVAPIVIGGGLFLALGIYAWKIRNDSFMPHALFSRDRNLAMALVFVFLEGLVFGAANVYVPFQTAVLYQSTFLKVTLVFSITLICYTIVSPIAAFICSRFKKVRILIVAGYFCFLIFAICMATATLKSRDAIWGFQIFLGTGLSLVLNALVTVAQLSAPPEYIAIASGLMAAVRSLGVTIAVALYSAIFHSRISNLLPTKIAAAALSNGLPKSSLPMFISALANNEADALAKIAGVTPKIIGASVIALKEAYLESFKPVWIAVCCFSAVGVIGSLFFLNPAKDLNNKIDAPAESEKDLYG